MHVKMWNTCAREGAGYDLSSICIIFCCEPLTGMDQPQKNQSVKEKKPNKTNINIFPRLPDTGTVRQQGGDLDTRTRIQTRIKVETVIIQGWAGR